MIRLDISMDVYVSPCDIFNISFFQTLIHTTLAQTFATHIKGQSEAINALGLNQRDLLKSKYLGFSYSCADSYVHCLAFPPNILCLC